MSESTVEHFDGDSLQSEYLQHVFFAIEEYKNFISNCSRISKLWIQYLYHISLVKDFIYAERTADWNLHLVTVKRMLNLFAVAGRVDYAKSARFIFRAWMHFQNNILGFTNASNKKINMQSGEAKDTGLASGRTLL